MQDKIFIIAEAGVNHNGSLAMGKQMIDSAVASGADAVKFQAFKAEQLVCVDTEKAGYQKESTSIEETQFAMLKKLELRQDDFYELARHCKEKGIEFIVSPFDMDSVTLLYEMGVTTFKIPSGEITNLPYLERIGSLKRKIILSTGMADLDEISTAMDILTQSGSPLANITLLHCTTSYPTPFHDVNLKAMATLRDVFKVDVGYSDHTEGIEVAVAAAALGAVVIEKHFTLDKSLPGPDHKASIEPDELAQMVRSIRHVEQAMGKVRKVATPSDLLNRDVVRKSIVAARDIKKGEIFTKENITVKRPGTGISPMKWYSVLGKKAHLDFTRDSLISIP